ncbi:MAG: GNAT family N-acetyltransferase [Sneathiella sp.]
MTTIRTATKSDVTEISTVICDALRYSNAKDYSEAVINRLFESFSPKNIATMMDRRTVFVALEDDRIIGTAGLEKDAVKTVFVAPNQHRKGVGSLLMNVVETSAVETGLVSLTVSSSLTAKSFYEALGYEVLSHEFFGEEETVFMQRKLPKLSNI